MRYVVGLVLALAALAMSATVSAAPADLRVVVVGDSVATGMYWHDDAIAAMQAGLAVKWDVAVCRTVGGQSCPFDGQRPPTLLEQLCTNWAAAPDVVVELGYNDRASSFADEVEAAVDDLLADGTKRIYWLMLREAREPYPALNDVLRAAAKRHPQLQLIDWNAYSAGHPDWFQTDGVHLLESGGVAMAHLVHASVMERVDPLRVLTRPKLGRDRAYSLQLRAAGGAPPYQWSIVHGRPPHGIHLLADGRLFGRTAERTARRFEVGVRDADGTLATASLSSTGAPH